jgi:hypothetical protein
LEGHKTPETWAREGAALAPHIVYLDDELLKPPEGSTDNVLQAPPEYAPACGQAGAELGIRRQSRWGIQPAAREQYGLGGSIPGSLRESPVAPFGTERRGYGRIMKNRGFSQPKAHRLIDSLQADLQGGEDDLSGRVQAVQGFARGALGLVPTYGILELLKRVGINRSGIRLEP